MIIMKNLMIYFFLLIFSTGLTFAQQSSYAESFDWMVKTFTENDAGYQYVIDKKGMEEYTKHTNFYREKAVNAASVNDCLSAMNNWLFFFRKLHIGAYYKPFINQNTQTVALTEQSKDSIRALYRNEETIDLTEVQVRELLKKKKGKLSPIEGIWNSNNYSIGIIGKPGKVNQFVAFIIKADGIYWTPKQKKAEFTLNKDSSFSMVYGMRDHSKRNEQARLVGNSGNFLLMINNLWTKVYPEASLTQKDELFLKLRTAASPFMERLSEKTLYLRIPSFQVSQKGKIDSLLLSRDSLIRSTPNLILDIRNGTGGSSYSYFKLIPYFYTQPIRSVGMQYYATELNARSYEKYATTYSDTSAINYCLRIASKMRQNIGSFFTEDRVSIDSSYTASPLPVKVAIICNQYNGSTDEALLFDAKQSSKVKVFGRPTAGALDFSNVNPVDSPDGMFQLILCMTASYRIPNFPIDGIGIQPDFFIDDTIPEEDWIYYVKSTIEH
jgi:hypothetical protein